MLHVRLDKENGIAVFEPDSDLSEKDFKHVASIIDPYISEHGKLNGLVIHAKSFPGWDSFAALIKHIQFVKNHHEKISHIAIATDSTIGTFAVDITKHFVHAKIKVFTFDELKSAKEWILND